jgi:hypothetical protein
MLAISNTKQKITTTSINTISINYTGGAAAIDGAAQRIDLITGGTSGGSWHGLKIVGSSAASGVAENAVRIEPITAGAGTEIAVNIGTGWDYGIYSATAGNNYFAGNVGIGTTNPLALLSVGSGSLFQVDTNGDMIKIKNLTYAWPGSHTTNGVLTNNGSGTLTWTLVSSSAIADDSLDFIKFEDTLDLDANLILNQTAYTWTQNFTGTTTAGLTYNANSLTSGSALVLNTSSNPAAAGPISPVQFNLTNANATTATTIYGVDVKFTNNPSIAGNNEYAMRIQNQPTSNATDTAVNALLLIDNADTSASGSTVVTSAIEIQNTGGLGYNYLLNTPSIDIASNGTITNSTWNGNSIADAYVNNTITIDGGTFGSNNVNSGSIWTTLGQLTIGDNGDNIVISAANWDMDASGNLFANGGISTYDNTVTDGYGEFAGLCLGNGTSCITSWANAGGNVNGTGTANYLAKWSDADTLGQSGIYDNGTNVGIGTITPGAKLAVNADSSYTGAGGEQIRISGASDTTKRIGLGYNTSADQGFIQAYQNGGSVKTLSLNPDGGNVGVGTTTPASKLEVEGTVNGIFEALRLQNVSGSGDSSARLVFENFTGRTAYIASIYTSDGVSYYPSLAFATANNTGTAERVRIDNFGNVGIGTTVPPAKLSVGASSQFQVDSNGDMIKVKSLTYAWPSSHTANAVLTNNGSGTLSWTTVGAVTIADNSLDFIKFENTLDLDADLTLNQTTYTWTQNFTGTTTTGLTYNANSLTSGKGLSINSTATALTGTLAEVVLSGNATGNTGTVFRVASTGASNAGPAMMITNLGTGGSFRVNDETGDTDTTPFLIDASGSVGIGTTAPATALDVNGTIIGNGIAVRNSYLNTLGLWSVGSSPYYGILLKTDASGGYVGGVSGTGTSYVSGSGYYNGTNWYTTSNQVATMTANGTNGIQFFATTGLTSNSTYTPTEVMRVTMTGTVGIGTTTPSTGLKLDVEGKVGATEYCDNAGANCITPTNMTGSYLKLNGTNSPTAAINWGGQNLTNVNKLDAIKIDPPVKIKGKQYATWGWEGIGLRTDVVGIGSLENGVFTIDLAKQPEASDLWLFYHVVAEDTIIPFVTPQDEAYLMAKMEGSVFTVKAIMGKKDAKFSYRLSAKRIDMNLPEQEVNVRKERSAIYVDVDAYDKNGNLKEDPSPSEP